jgi:hypothetical protein
VIGVHLNYDGEDAAKVRKVMTSENLRWRSFVDRGAIADKWKPAGTPTFFIIDPNGVIRYRWAGAPGATAIDVALLKLIQEAKEAKASAVRVQIKRIQEALQLYKVKTAKFPAALGALTEGKDPLLKARDLNDPWENHYLYDPTGPRNQGTVPDVWTVTPEKEIIGNWAEGKR